MRTKGACNPLIIENGRTRLPLPLVGSANGSGFNNRCQSLNSLGIKKSRVTGTSIHHAVLYLVAIQMRQLEPYIYCLIITCNMTAFFFQIMAAGEKFPYI